MAEKCEIELAYAIGVSRPVSVLVDTFGTGKVSDEALSEIVQRNFDLRPNAIIKQFDLRNLPLKMVADSIQDLPHMDTLGVPIFLFHGKKSNG